MCTAISLLSRKNENVFGRTMDFHCSLDPQFAIFPAGCKWEKMSGDTCTDRYGVAGINRHVKNRYILFDGVNEAGFAGAFLYFKDCVDFPAPSEDRSSKELSTLDFLHYALGNCATLDELRELLAKFILVGIKDSMTNGVAPIHWIFTDLSGKSVVVEQTGTGIEIYEDPIGVLTNSPDFPWQMTNLRNYTQVTSGQTELTDWNGLAMEPFGQAAGTSALPGGYTSPARFVRAAFQKSHVEQPEKTQNAILTGFHILDDVSIPKGVVKTAEGSFDYTQYTTMIDLQKREYYFKTYDNPQIIKVELRPYWETEIHDMLDLGSIERTVTYGVLN